VPEMSPLRLRAAQPSLRKIAKHLRGPRGVPARRRRRAPCRRALQDQPGDDDGRWSLVAAAPSLCRER
jgi:hypothetical protein